MHKNSEAEKANLGTCSPLRSVEHKLGDTKTLGWKDEQGIDHEGPRNVKKFVPYLKGCGEAEHLKQGYGTASVWRISMDWGRGELGSFCRNTGERETMVVLTIMTVGKHKRARI